MFTDEPHYPTDRHGLIHRAIALEAGVTDARLRTAVASGELVRAAKGMYFIPATVNLHDRAAVAESAMATHRLRSIAVACLPNHSSATVLSHSSAAAMHGLPMLKPRLDQVHLTNGEQGGGRQRPTSVIHASELPTGDVVDIDGIRVTSLARTAADIAQSASSNHPLAFAKALAVFDAARRAGVEADALALQLERRRRRGTRAAKAALAYADPQSESIGESWGRAQMIQAALPVPELQVEHRVGGKLYRVDGDWDGRLAWEFDGFVKYGRSLAPGETIADAVWREKEREDALRAAGVMIIRAIWSMLERGTMVPLIARWLDHFGLR